MCIWTYCRTLLLNNFPQDRFSSKMGHRPIIIDRCVTSWMQIFPICGSEEEDPLPGHRIWPLWIFSWGFVKNVIYQGNWPTTLEELRGRNTNSAALVTPQMLQNTWQSHPRCTHRVALTIHRNSVSFISSYVKVYVNNSLFTLEIITYFSIPLAWTSCIIWNQDVLQILDTIISYYFLCLKTEAQSTGAIQKEI